MRARDVELRVEERALHFLVGGEDQLAYGSALHLPVHPVADMLDIDWEIERDVPDTDDRREARFCARDSGKKTISGVVMWWDRVFQGEEPRVDVATINERKNVHPSSTANIGSSHTASQKVWEEAHACSASA